MHLRHKWKTFFDGKIAIKRECQKCDRKEINVWGDWQRVNSTRMAELYAVL